MPGLRVGVVGVGHLGKEHARILAGLPEVELVGVADSYPAQAEAIAQRYGVRAFVDHRDLLPLVQAAVIVVPTTHHHAVACDFLHNGVPLLVEKPLAQSLDQADDLHALSARRGVLLQVGHIERFNPAFEELQRHPLQPRFIACERYSGYSGRSTDIGVVLDLMIHDIDLVLTLVKAPLRSVEALGVVVLGGHEDLAQARLTFANGCVADLKASRVHPSAVRRLHVFGPEGFAGVDFARRHLTLMQPADHLRQRRLDPGTLATLKTELFSRHFQMQELDCNSGDQLTRELQDFVRCVRLGGRPRVDAAAGRDALAVASQILDSLQSHSWGDSTGLAGPRHLPAPSGQLFVPPARDRAA
jgi:predicted dehydrogenase